MGIVVRAKTVKDEEKVFMGYYDHKRRYQGDVFEIASEQAFSEKWMEKVSDDAPEGSSPDALAKKEQLVARLKAGREHKAMQKSQLLEG